MTISDFLYEDFELDLFTTTLSAIKNPEFIDLSGQDCSTIYLDSSILLLSGTDDRINFLRNVSPDGSTIVSLFSWIDSTSMVFEGNAGFEGSCYNLDSFSYLDDLSSTYSENIANKGGVVFAINDSLFYFLSCEFARNIAIDSGSVLYAMYNSDPKALEFVDCYFHDNYAYQNLM